MEKQEFIDLLRKKILILDGAMGTMLQKYGFTTGCPDELNVTESETLKKIHQEYRDAGSDIIITSTFGANRLKLKKYGLETEVKKLNEAAVKNVREACPNCIVAGGIGPLGEFVAPVGTLEFEEVYEIFKEQVDALHEADILIIETISDIKILKAVLLAAQSFNGPVIASMTIQDGRTTTGTDIETFVTIADCMGADVISANCSDGPEGMLETAKEMIKHTNKPICLEPNAGLPRLVGKETVWDYPIAQFAKNAEKFAELGANIIGGCCGTNPDFIKAVAEKVKGKSPINRHVQEKTKLCSRTKTLTIEPMLIVGERINPTNKKKFTEEIKLGQTNYVREMALAQEKEGASLLDINVGVPGIKEKDSIVKAIRQVQNVVSTPIVIDTSDIVALEAALFECDGKPLINSVNGSNKSLQEILPLAKKFGAAVIGLCVDDEGVPKTIEKRLEIANRIITQAEKVGLRREDVIIDAVVLTMAVKEENKNIILDSLKELKKLGYRTILGVSNISHGLPNRSEINSKFLTEAKNLGLDLAIINPLDNVFQKDTHIRIDLKQEKVSYKDMPVKEQLYKAILLGDKENIVFIINKGLKIMTALEVNNILIDAMQEVGDKFGKKEYFLPQVLASAKTMKNAFERLKPEIKKEGGNEKGVVLFATVEHDIHDIGKNIIIALLESHNYKIIDLGANIKTETIVDEVIKQKPNIVALSALMTTTVIEMEEVIKELRQKHIDIPVIVGGAVVTDDYANQIKAAYGQDALQAVKKINELIVGINGKNN
ncbi:homocysteine S-methyltransferase family protein [archaeon]|nr:homocysteine S-methyltransferase family protein [archaeon]MBL7057462.1 homocysteine S-methyltransferase family protein [Candidatus Woesearchaeota archaeon]